MNKRSTLGPARSIVGRTTGSHSRPRGVMCDMRGCAAQRQQVTRLDTFSRRVIIRKHDISRYIVMCRGGDVLLKGSPGPRASRRLAPAARAAIAVVSLEVW